MCGTHPSWDALETSGVHTAAPHPALQGKQTLRNPSTTRLPLPERVRRSLVPSLSRSRNPRFPLPPPPRPSHSNLGAALGKLRRVEQSGDGGQCGHSQPVPGDRRGEDIVMYKIPRTGSAWCTGTGSLRVGLGGKAACQWRPQSRSPGGGAEEQTRLLCLGDAHPVLSRPGQ